MPARLPKTLMSSSEFVPRRFEPCTETQAHLAGRVHSGHHMRVVAQHLSVHVGRNAAHRVVGGGKDGHRLGDRIDTQIGAGELGDVGQLGLQHLGAEVGAVEQHVVLVRTGAAALQHLHHHRPGDDVAGREILDGGRVALHEALARRVAQDRPLAAGALGQQDAESPPGRSGGTGRTPCPPREVPCAVRRPCRRR